MLSGQRWQLHLTLCRLLYRGHGNGGVLGPLTGSAYIVWFFRAMGAKIGKNCKIGPNVTIGPDVVVGDGVRLQRCVLLSGSKVKDHAWVKSTIVGWNSSVGRWARLENVTVLGDDVTIGDEIYVNGGSILPHKSIKANVDVPSIIM